MTKFYQTNQHHLEENVTMKSTIFFTNGERDISGTFENADDQWNFESLDPFFLQHFPFGIASYEPGTQTDGKEFVKAVMAAKNKDFQFS